LRAKSSGEIGRSRSGDSLCWFGGSQLRRASASDAIPLDRQLCLQSADVTLN
jgi:hypothetical protein